MNKPILTTITIITVCLAATVLAGIYYFAPEQGDDSAMNKVPTQATGYVQPNYDSLLEQIEADRAADKAYYDEELRKANEEIAELKSRPTQTTTVVTETDNENWDILIARLNEQDDAIKELESNVYKYYNIILKEQADQNVRINDNYTYILDDEEVAMSYYNELIESLEKCKSNFVTLEKLQSSQDEQDNRYSSILNDIQDQIDELKAASKTHVTQGQLKELQELINKLQTAEKPFAYVDPYYPQDVDKDDDYKTQRLNTKYTVLNRLLNSLHEEGAENTE